jgi:hypothetical protein
MEWKNQTWYKIRKKQNGKGKKAHNQVAWLNKAEEFQLKLENCFKLLETEGEVEEMAGNI